ncbi:MAG: hypothetical protein WBV93_05200 [Anaerobacillus sp.]
MKRNWKTPEQIQFQKNQRKKLLYLALPLLSILLGVLIAVISNQGI